MGIFDFFRTKQVNKIDAVKEMSEASRKVNRALWRFMGNNMPVWKDFNSQTYVEQGYNANYLLYSIIQWKAQKAAMIDYTICEVGPGGKKKYIENHPALDLIYNPNQWQSKQQFFEQVYGFKMLDGNSYIYTPKLENGPNKGKPTEMHVLPAPITEVVTGTNFDPIGSYRVIYSPEIGNDFEASEVLHLRYANYDFDYGSYVYGISPLKAAWYNVQTSNSNTAARKASFDNMGALGLLYQKDQEIADSITDTQRKAAQSALDKKIRGTDNKGRILWSAGDYGYINFGADPVDLALIDDAKMTRDELCIVFHVQPQIFGNSDASTYANMQEARKISYIDGILPEVQSFVDEFNRQVMPAFGKNLKLEAVTDNIPELQKDLKDLSGWLQGAYWLKANEKREVMGYDLDPEMDIYHIPAGLIPSNAVTFPDLEGEKLESFDYLQKEDEAKK